MIVEKKAAMMMSAAKDFAVFGPALRPTKIPTETGLNSDSLRDDESEKRGAESHEQADKNVRNRGGYGDSKDEIEASSRRACERRQDRTREYWKCQTQSAS